MIQMIVVGALKESYLREGQQYFLDEISKREDVELIELEDEKVPETASEKELTMIRQIEGQKILSKVNRLNTMIAMDIDGKSMTKDRWSNLFEQHRTQKKGMTFEPSFFNVFSVKLMFFQQYLPISLFSHEYRLI